MNGLSWWGYLHINGTVQVKRYFSDRDLDDAFESPFVRNVTNIFVASGRDEALRIAKEKLAVHP